MFTSFALSHWLGIVYGVWRLHAPITTSVLSTSNLSKELGIPRVLKRLGFSGLLGERPIIYEAFSPEPAKLGDDSPLVFVEIELKDGAGFYSGQVSQFSILRDDEPHKPVYLINAYYKTERSASYSDVDADGILIDLADALVVQVKRVEMQAYPEPEPSL